jgi:hypothetical protein
MRIVLSVESFSLFGGTQSYTLTTAMELERLGHDVAIYSPDRGAMAEFAREQSVHVIGKQELPRSCDVLISSDAATCHELAGRYLDAVRIFVVHSVDFMLQAPPQLHDRCQAIVVLNDRVRRAVEARAWHAPIVRLRQPIDLLRFGGLGPGYATARTALVASNYLKGARAKLIEAACRANGLEVRWIGNNTHANPAPELAIAGARLVIGLGRSVLEAMAAGRAAYVYGVIGGDGWVTPERYAAMEADGFAGTSASAIVVDGARLIADLQSWDENMGDLNRDLAAAHHSAREHAIELVNLARKLDAAPPIEPSLSNELAHLIRLQWQSEGRAVANLAEADRLSSLLAQAEANVTQMQDAVRAVNQRLEALRSTRRYRLACRIASPLDRLRYRLSGARGDWPTVSG